MGNGAFFGYARPENITAMVVFTKDCMARTIYIRERRKNEK